MKMTILDRGDHLTQVVLSGRLDMTAAEEMGERFAQATAARGRPAIIDLSEVEFMASPGIALMLVNGKRLLTAGHKMVLLNPRELVESVLKTSKLEKVLPVAHSLDEAMQILRGVSGTPLKTSENEPPLRRQEPAATLRPTTEGELKLAIKNEFSELKGLSAAVDEFLNAHGVPSRATYAVDLAIEELVVNVIRYAYVDDRTHLIEVELAVTGGQVILRLVDDGRPFDPRSGPALDLHAEEREAGGLGLLLVLDMVDVLKYRRMDEKNWVEVRVHLSAGDGSSDPSLPGGT